jgi:hypothetical protein
VLEVRWELTDELKSDKAIVEWNLAPNDPGDFIFLIEAPLP